MWGASLASATERHGELAMLARLCALGALLSVAAAAGPEFDLAKFKETYVREGTVVPLPPPLLSSLPAATLGVAWRTASCPDDSTLTVCCTLL